MVMLSLPGGFGGRGRGGPPGGGGRGGPGRGGIKKKEGFK